MACDVRFLFSRAGFLDLILGGVGLFSALLDRGFYSRFVCRAGAHTGAVRVPVGVFATAVST